MGYTLGSVSLLEKGFSFEEINALHYWRSIAGKVESGGVIETAWPSLDYHPVIQKSPEESLIHERIYVGVGFAFVARCNLGGITSCKLEEVNCARCILLRKHTVDG